MKLTYSPTSEERHPAFFHQYQYIGGKKLGVIKLNEAIADRLSSDPMTATIHPRFLPMVVPPSPWTSFEEGGYRRAISKSILSSF
jgi:DNA-directed RNA polymerase